MSMCVSHQALLAQPRVFIAVFMARNAHLAGTQVLVKCGLPLIGCAASRPDSKAAFANRNDVHSIDDAFHIQNCPYC